jgi:hypothetical protein
MTLRIAAKLGLAGVLIFVLLTWSRTQVDFVYTGF